jgi:predicted DNA-binding transcriptional regulator AlpA
MTDNHDYLTKIALCRLLGFSRSMINGMMANPTFPKAVTFSKRAMWRKADVLAWVAAQ